MIEQPSYNILWWLHQDLKNTQELKTRHLSSMTKSQLFHFLAFELVTAQKSQKVKKFLYNLPIWANSSVDNGHRHQA
jgi:hypothetical protein